MCRNPKLWIGLAAVAVVVAIAAPNVGGVLPLLLVAACPLSMLVMMGGLAGMTRGRETPSGASGEADELARLRAEVSELRDRVGPR